MNANNLAEYIKKQIGVDLIPCTDFPGVKEYGGEKYINFILTDSDRSSESEDFNKLLSFVETHFETIKSVEPNGLNRIAVFINRENTILFDFSLAARPIFCRIGT